MGLPVVVTKAGGVSELVDDGIDGIMVEPGNSKDLALGLERIAKNPDLAVRVAKAAREKVNASFKSDRSAQVLARRLTLEFEGNRF